MKEKLIYWLLKTCGKEEQLAILTEMVFQLLPKYHIHKNPKYAKRSISPISHGALSKDEAMAKFDELITGIKVVER